MSQGAQTRELATLGGGCFWCLEAVFELVRGVLKVESGYAGGSVKNPGYREVCTGATGHAEVVQVTFDPSIVSYGDILNVFFASHDPTTLNRQGPDHGTQYRSVIFFHSPEQERIARDTIARLESEHIWDNVIVTQVAPVDAFYRAEDYHQHYFRENPTQPYCLAMVAPKVAKFRKQFTSLLKS
jgi:peptide-methionine (S)-S-oxide reductase